MAKESYGTKEKFVCESPCENVVMDSRYECPICLNYLEDAVLTSCGHRFCLRCINLWLEQKGASCPIDVSPLTQKDIFPDNFTRREIVQARVCSTVKGDVHGEGTVPEGGGGDQCDHLVKGGGGGELCGGGTSVHDPLVTAMYERIILLEQRAHEQDIVVENLRRKIGEVQLQQQQNALRVGVAPPEQRLAWEEEVALRCCNGLFVWRVKEFSAQLHSMKAVAHASPMHAHPPSTPQMLYSPRFYTRPFCGYRFCVRLNLSPRSPGHLSLVVHVVRGEFDDILPWPFSGRITLELVNQRDFPRGECVREVVVVGGEGAPRAFFRPPPEGHRSPINPRGFGYMEFVALGDLEAGGFLVNDTLIVKVQVEQRAGGVDGGNGVVPPL